MAYFTGVLKQRLAVGNHVVVHDLGAGTFDVSVAGVPSPDSMSSPAAGCPMWAGWTWTRRWSRTLTG
ncbi:hypothetical protein Dvina_01965 [Dactylosporangium vinaceum]|uniref:Uncharacterized protein n=1 Tax=Dactylosporangium vinaceum TaxID=53362 RepID=A0ABV5MF53_9ACTN|nr:hypothetical protein [Dactylosporangium vinaceum]UAB97002.1 hypothetical protein Dvina_01965 [Dactylosporangium vinaceum]